MQEQIHTLKQELSALEERMQSEEDLMHAAAMALPNDTHPAAPIGPEANARVVHVHGARPQFDFEARDHLQLGTGARGL